MFPRSVFRSLRRVRCRRQMGTKDIIDDVKDAIEKNIDKPVKAANEIGKKGYMAVSIPKDAGKDKGDYKFYAKAVEVVSSLSASVGSIMIVHNSLYLEPIWKFGNENQVKKYVKPYNEGEKLGCFALTEYECSDPAAITTSVKIVREDKVKYILNGTKCWVANGAEAKATVVFAALNEASPKDSMFAFIVPIPTDGLVVKEDKDKRSLHGFSLRTLEFKNCQLEQKDILGEPERGYKIALWALDCWRIGIAAQAVGIAQAALDMVVKNADHKACKKKYRDLIGIQHRVGEMHARIEDARLLTAEAASKRPSKKEDETKFTNEAAQAKLLASQVATYCTRECMQAVICFCKNIGEVECIKICSIFIWRTPYLNDLTVTSRQFWHSFSNQENCNLRSLRHVGCRRLMSSDKYRKEVKDILEKHINEPVIAAQEIGKKGFMGMAIPGACEGVDPSNDKTQTKYTDYADAVEEVSRISPSVGSIMIAHSSLYLHPIWKFGNKDQMDNYIDGFCKGEKLGSCAISEEGCSDPANLLLHVEEYNGYLIEAGVKTWVSNISSEEQAKATIVFGSMDESKGKDGISAFIVPIPTPGVDTGDKLYEDSLHGLPIGNLHFEECQLEDDKLLGQLGEGYVIAMWALDCWRIAVAAQAVGIAQASLDLVLENASHKACQVKYKDLIGIQHKVGEMKTRIEAARLLTKQAAAIVPPKKDDNTSFTKEAARAKLIASQVATFCTSQCLEIISSSGVTDQLPMRRFFDYCNITEVYGGSLDTLRRVISSHIFV